MRATLLSSLWSGHGLSYPVTVPRLLDEPIVAGRLPSAIVVAGVVAGIVLLAGRTRSWWLRSVPLALAVGVTVSAVSALAVVVLRPFPESLPLRVLVWIAVLGTAGGLGWARRRARWSRRALVALAVVTVLITCVMKVNAFYGYRTSIGAALGIPSTGQIEFSDIPTHVPLVTPPLGQPLAQVWRGSRSMPTGGLIVTTEIPGLRSHLPARPGWLYLPPAYLTSPRARLPVLVLLPGQPGGPADWIFAGRLPTVMDAYAATHAGLAPVVVVPDVNGSDLGNSLCLDSPRGNAETYLADDVPAWLVDHLDVDTSHLAIGGFSFGGTCALQLALRRPQVYPTFLDVSGPAQPTLGDDASTIEATFAGDTRAFERVTPLAELGARAYPTSAGVFVAGRDDDLYRPQIEQVADAARAAQIQTSVREVSGGHSWSIAADALAAALPWIAGRTGLDVPAPGPTSDTAPVTAGPADRVG